MAPFFRKEGCDKVRYLSCICKQVVSCLLGWKIILKCPEYIGLCNQNIGVTLSLIAVSNVFQSGLRVELLLILLTLFVSLFGCCDISLGFTVCPQTW